jgi:hypothetical protein
MFYGTLNGKDYVSRSFNTGMKSYVEYDDFAWNDILNEATEKNKKIAPGKDGFAVLVDYTDEDKEKVLKDNYKALTIAYIREKYDINDECKLIASGIEDKDDADYIEYRNYVDNCKSRAKKEIYGLIS